MAEELHVLFGGGQVGQPLAQILLRRGKRVRIVKRSGGGLPEGTESVQGDATNLNFCVEAARGASTVYHCMNPPYYGRIWAELLPRYMELSLIHISEPTRLLSISYAVFCLKKKKK